jgi:hypothetical protein
MNHYTKTINIIINSGIDIMSVWMVNVLAYKLTFLNVSEYIKVSGWLVAAIYTLWKLVSEIYVFFNKKEEK